MAKRNNGGDSELNLDSLMDAVTNVVGVLMIVFVVMSLNTAITMQKILSELPPVTKEEHEAKKQEVAKLTPVDVPKIEEDKKKAEQALKKAIDQLQTVDTSDMQSKMKFMDLESFRKKLTDAKKLREQQKAEVDKLIAEGEDVLGDDESKGTCVGCGSENADLKGDYSWSGSFMKSGTY